MIKKLYKLGCMELFKTYKLNQMKEHKLSDIFWEATLTCNAKCKHCGSNALIKKYDDELTTKQVKKIFYDISKDFLPGEILINITGGEPLVRKDIFEISKYLKKELGFHIGMTTNGILLNNVNIQKLKDAGLETISISIDGVGKTHDKFRGVEGSYNKIIDNIKELVKANFLSEIQVTTVFNKNNIDELDELYNVMLELGIQSWRLVSIDEIGRACDNNNLLLDGDDLKKILNFIKKNKNKSKMEILYGCPSFLGTEYEKEVRGQYFNCRTGINVASILYNGDLFVCPNVPRRKELIQGNALKDNFKEVWENKYKIFRNKDRTSNKECSKCEYYGFCLGGSFHTWDFDKNIQKKCVYKMIK